MSAATMPQAGPAASAAVAPFVRSSDRPLPARLTTALLATVWCGAVFGFLEALVLCVKRDVLRQFLFQSPDSPWMTPLASTLLFAACGSLVFGPLWLCRARLTLAGVVACCSFVGCYCCLRSSAALAGWANLLLAGGLAVQAERLVSRHNASFLRIVRWTAVWLLAAIPAIGVLQTGAGCWREARALAALPAPPPPDAPNVLFIVLDTVRAESLSLYGHGGATSPRLDEFARRGVVFDRAVATSSWTLPSHAGMFTGRYAHELQADWYVPLEEGPLTLAEHLARRGYVTTGFVGNRYYCSAESGLTRGFVHYEDYLRSPGEVLRSCALGDLVIDNRIVRQCSGWFDKLGRKDAARVNREFLSWLDQQGDRPFFAFVNYYDAHNPYLPRGCDQPCGPESVRDKLLMMDWGNLDKRSMGVEDIQIALAAYEDAIRSLDRRLGELFAALEQRGVLDRTLVIVTSDHGEHFGEHGVFLHGTSLYRPLLHVPLLISFPGTVPQGVRISEPVTLRDLAATVADLSGSGDRAPFPGRSLAATWRGQPHAGLPPSPVLSSVRPWRTRFPDHAFSPAAKGPMWSLVADGLHYIRRGDGAEELYDFDGDPAERHNLASDAESAGVVAGRRAALDRLIAD
jgi:arylsulfatase A-like enzyme